MTYLQDHKPRRAQYRSPRRDKPTGCIVVHTAENTPDTVGPDGGAESVARFIATRSDPGSYHVLADSDSWVHVVPFGAEAYGDGTGSNRWAIHVSVATTAARWPRMSKAWRDGAVQHLAEGTVAAIRWLDRVHGVTVPLRRITRDQSNQGRAGFISHGERDPGRRSDPGAGFPWSDYLAAVKALLDPKPPTPKPQPRPPAPTPTPEPEDDDMGSTIIYAYGGTPRRLLKDGRLTAISDAFAKAHVKAGVVKDVVWVPSELDWRRLHETYDTPDACTPETDLG